MGERELRPLRRDFQIVFQDPQASLNPRHRVNEILSEPLELHALHPGADARRQRIDELLDLVGLSPRFATRLPHELSGGQRQRVGIARALAVGPKLIVLDEAVSALDVSVRAQILNLLERLQTELGVAYVFIAHDLAVVRHIASEVAVMYVGRIMECGPAEAIYRAPSHPYTAALLSAVPVPDVARERARERILLHGDPADPRGPPRGAHFTRAAGCASSSATPNGASARRRRSRPAPATSRARPRATSPPSSPSSFLPARCWEEGVARHDGDRASRPSWVRRRWRAAGSAGMRFILIGIAVFILVALIGPLVWHKNEIRSTWWTRCALPVPRIPSAPTSTAAMCWPASSTERACRWSSALAR